MKLIIDIPEEKYDVIKNNYNTFPAEMKEWGLGAIKNGTPLPKGHGRLIDADAFKHKVCTYQQTGCGSCKHSLCCPADVPTIIEADKESEDKK